jgi:hypothetical protein
LGEARPASAEPAFELRANEISPAAVVRGSSLGYAKRTLSFREAAWSLK